MHCWGTLNGKLGHILRNGEREGVWMHRGEGKGVRGLYGNERIKAMEEQLSLVVVAAVVAVNIVIEISSLLFLATLL